MIKIEAKYLCCGCGACEQKCPLKCIQLVEDDEGFLYPSVDESVCVNCELCQKVCPIFNKKRSEMDALVSFAVSACKVRLEDCSLLSLKKLFVKMV